MRTPFVFFCKQSIINHQLAGFNMNCFLSVLTLILAISKLSFAKTIVETKLVSFTDPFFQYTTENTCCEFFCDTRCRHYFKLCILSLSDNQNRACGDNDNQLETDVLEPKQYKDGDILRTADQVENPWIVTLDFIPFDGFWFKFEIWDKNLLSNDELLSTTIERESISPSLNKSTSVPLNRRYRESLKGQLSFEFRVFCEENYYNTSCEVFCLAQNNNNGRYTCDPTTGAKICLQGWSGPNCDLGMFKPTLKFKDDINIIHAGSSVDMSCQVVSNPQPSYHLWYRNDLMIANTTNATYTVQNLTLGDSGDYSCKGVHEYGDMTSDKVNLTVWEHVEPTTMPSLSTETAENSDVTLTCMSNIHPLNPQYRWIGPDNKTVSTSNMVTILNLTLHETGVSYVCEVTLDGRTARSQPVTINVLGLGVPIVQYDTVTDVPRGSTTTLNCTSTGGLSNVTYQWLDQNDQILSETSILEFENIQPNQTGYYRCKTSKLSAETYSSIVTVTVIWIDTPTIHFTNMETSYHVGSDVNLTCVLESSPAPHTFRWTRNNETLVANTSSSVLALRNVSSGDMGDYECTAWSFRDVTSPLRHLAVFEHLEPDISNPTASNFLSFGSSVTLSCKPSSVFLDPEYNWLDEDDNVISDQSTLVVNGTERSQSTTYRCRTIKDGVNFTSAPITLTVSWLLKPNITVNQSATAIVITCISDGFPAPIYQWYRNDELIAHVATTQLYLPFTIHQNIGEYHCASTNSFGTLSSTKETIQPVDYCKMNGKTCHAHATCSNANDGFRCACVSGYHGDGENCQPASATDELQNDKDDLEDERNIFRIVTIVLIILLVLLLLAILIKMCCQRHKANSQSKYAPHEDHASPTSKTAPTSFDNNAYGTIGENEMKEKDSAQL